MEREAAECNRVEGGGEGGEPREGSSRGGCDVRMGLDDVVGGEVPFGILIAKKS